MEDNRMWAQPVTPPMQPSQIPMPEQRSTWATVIGVIAIVLGSGGILGGCWGLVVPWLLKVIKDLIPEGEDTILGAVEPWTAWMIVGSILTLCLGTLLLFSGVGLLKRRRWGVLAGVCWAVFKILFVLVNSVISYMIQAAQFESIAQQTSGMPGMGSGFYVAMGVFGVSLGIAIGWAFPVFLLIWLLRAKIKAEVADWS